MRVAVTSYPTLFQTPGGLSMKVRATVDALQVSGVDARLIDLLTEKLGDYDVLHVYSVINGVYRIVQLARNLEIPVVVSPIVGPPYSKWHSHLSQLAGWVLAKATGYTITTTYRHACIVLDGAAHLAALGQAEAIMLRDFYGQPSSKISLVPNGIGDQFFSADRGLFQSEYGIENPFVLHAGSIGDYKNQLGLIHALRDDDIRVVLIGDDSGGRGYLRRCMDIGGDKISYLGSFDHSDPLLASAYAAADVVVLPSAGEVMPNNILEALASGTPAVVTRFNSLDIHRDLSVIREIEPRDESQIRANVLELISSPPAPERCRALVSHLTWAEVATRLERIYSDIVDSPESSRERERLT